MRVVHLMASPFFGGPERQMLGLARHLPGDVVSIFLSFAEHGQAQPFMDEAQRHHFEGKLLQYNTPWFFSCVSEVADELQKAKADILSCSGYKPDLVGWRAARRVGIPVVSISHGWTAATWKVRVYESLDRCAIGWMDAVVCVSKAQADKVRAAGVAEPNIHVIHNAVGEEAFVEPEPAARAEMLSWFTAPPRLIVGAAGRLSPEKGYSLFIEAAQRAAKAHSDVGFVLFGEGDLRGELEQTVASCGLHGQLVLPGFRPDMARFLPHLDIHVMTSLTEGLPIVLLEAGAAGVPSVATAVGGIPEVIDDGVTGHLVPSGDCDALARCIIALLDDHSRRLAMGRAARDRVRQDFSFTGTAQHYHALFEKVLASHKLE
ncbi:MAG: glycosyltransferase family 4 protein [Planctomycetes bacterium]|nr:glycosyltransferase family 4 protein [Planctomycetota bacterium]